MLLIKNAKLTTPAVISTHARDKNIHNISYYLKSDILRWYNFKRFELCDPKNSLDIKGNIKGHMWFVSMGPVIENLINLNISTSYFLVTYIVVLLSL